MKYQDLKTLSKETSISVFTLRKFIKMGLPHFKVGGKYLINPEEFNDWFETHHRASSEPENPGLDQIISKALSEVSMEST
ncbi:MAG: helix-turn-helix domain-containing protein [Deltaproteobacteria bacterium]|nr:helix-turn-helix domain-containing protein [Deltaproteobacteria bacterium]